MGWIISSMPKEWYTQLIIGWYSGRGTLTLSKTCVCVCLCVCHYWVTNHNDTNKYRKSHQHNPTIYMQLSIQHNSTIWDIDRYSLCRFKHKVLCCILYPSISYSLGWIFLRFTKIIGSSCAEVLMSRFTPPAAMYLGSRGLGFMLHLLHISIDSIDGIYDIIYGWFVIVKLVTDISPTTGLCQGNNMKPPSCINRL